MVGKNKLFFYKLYWIFYFSRLNWYMGSRAQGQVSIKRFEYPQQSTAFYLVYSAKMFRGSTSLNYCFTCTPIKMLIQRRAHIAKPVL